MIEATEITTLKTRAAVQLVAGVANVEELDRLQVAERSHPDVAGGRIRVLEAIDARRGELVEVSALRGRLDLGPADAGDAGKPKAPPPPPADLSPGKPWREDRWAGRPQFNCRQCPYQTLEPQAIDQHLAAAHPEVWRSYLKTREA